MPVFNLTQLYGFFSNTMVGGTHFKALTIKMIYNPETEIFSQNIKKA
jgi:hypothetical protein